MNTVDYDTFDAFCARCGAGISFEVGWSVTCWNCGGNYEHTDEQLAEKAIEDKIADERARRTFLDKKNKILFLHLLKLGRPLDEQQMLDEIMDDVDFFEANAIRTGLPSIYDELL